ncbi:MAG TPA: TlpA disulfide reductase family protein [Gemmatimonadales bacterium]|jgi:peroxiredoxin|nr:TlpA disulfide reductase family protein [Gemmatimonadales bacterium]
MSKQWAVTGTVVAGLTLGAAALTWVAPDSGVAISRPAPNFRVVDLATRDSVSLDDYAGSVTLVNIWATWCLPCREEMPSMQKLYDSLGTKGFRIAAISIDEGSPEDVTAFAKKLDLSFDILHDRSGTVERLYQTTGVPESFLLDRRGILVKRVIGAHDWSSPANVAAVQRLLDQPEE